MTFPKEFKEAISQLPSQEKDKLIFRLLKKDLLLANRLMFELVSTKTVDEQRKDVKNRLSIQIDRATNNFHTIGYLNVYVRYMSGDINEHVNITKDKFGEVQLNIWMMSEILFRNKENILSATPGKASKFCTAVIARVFKIMLLIHKLHEDYLLDVRDDLEKLGELIGDNPYLMKAAIFNGLDINWLIDLEIPDDIIAIHKDLRQRGYLR